MELGDQVEGVAPEGGEHPTLSAFEERGERDAEGVTRHAPPMVRSSGYDWGRL